MRIITCEEPGKLVPGQTERPLIKNGYAQIRIRRIGVCGTDLHAFEGTQPYFSYPRVLGHELSGELVNANGVPGFTEGEIVTFIPYFSCGLCIACRSGKPNCCTAINVCGVHIDGGMVEFLNVPVDSLIHGEGLSFDELALVEPLAIGAHGIRRAGVNPGEYVLISTMKAADPVVTASPAVGQPASTSNVTIKITYSVLTVKKADLSQAIEDKMSDQIDKTKQKLDGNFLNDATITVQSQSSPTAATLSINEDTTAVPIINIANVKAQAKGKKTGDIKSAIGSWPGVKEVDVKLSPFWVSKVPKKDGKIKVILQAVKADSNSSGQP